MITESRSRNHSSLFNQFTRVAAATPRSRTMFVFLLMMSLLLNVYFIFSLFTSKAATFESIDHLYAVESISFSSCLFQDRPLIMKEIAWDKLNNIHSVCLCGVDNYCRCGPSAATDIIAFTPDMNGFIMVDRGAEPFGLATVGGFVEVGESIEGAAMREFKEETNLDITNLIQVKTFSSPHQDPRRPALSTVFIAKIEADDEVLNDLHAGDDAKGVLIWPLSDTYKLKEKEYEKSFGFAIHRQFILDALEEAVRQNWIKQSDLEKKS